MKFSEIWRERVLKARLEAKGWEISSDGRFGKRIRPKMLEKDSIGVSPTLFKRVGTEVVAK